MREQTLIVPAHPEFINGVPVYAQGGTVGEIIHRIQKGDPTKGWEGDPRMVVQYFKDTDQWALLRQTPRDPNKYVAIAVKKPGEPLDDRVIDQLVKYDSRRGFNAKKEVDAHNAKLEKERFDDTVASLIEKWDRVAFEVRKRGGLDL